MVLLRGGLALVACLLVPLAAISGDQVAARKNAVPESSASTTESIGHLPAPRAMGRKRMEPAPPITFHEEDSDGWSIAETAHFRIHYSQPRAFVEQVAAVAERARDQVARRWLGTDETWERRCDLFLYATARDLRAQTTGPPGVSQMEIQDGRVMVRKIELRCDEFALLSSVLPHEVTHVVLAGHFGGKGVPRWADEGMAVLAEPPMVVERHLRNLGKHRDELFDLRTLMGMDYPAPQSMELFYAQSVSLVKFLAAKKGPRTFTRFLQDGERQGYAAALLGAYGYRDFGELRTQWAGFAFGDPVALPTP